jgi:hypothetical protein
MNLVVLDALVISISLVLILTTVAAWAKYSKRVQKLENVDEAALALIVMAFFM